MVKPRAGMVVCDEDCAVSPGGSVEVRTHGGAIEPDWALTDPSFWTTNVDAMIRPAIGLRFKTMNEGVEFYMSYGRASGLDVARPGWNLDSTQQAFIASCIKANIGTAQSFRLCKELVGTYGNIGATSVDFHNFKRDLQEYVSGGDGEMIIKQFNQKREVSDGFYFDYQLDEENRLARLFWADPLARDNFSTFGDTISFDATYGTNRYVKAFQYA
nr:protein FAR1-RELATED SEQUENCE 5-like [Ipomoea batatas]